MSASSNSPTDMSANLEPAESMYVRGRVEPGVDRIRRCTSCRMDCADAIVCRRQLGLRQTLSSALLDLALHRVDEQLVETVEFLGAVEVELHSPDFSVAKNAHLRPDRSL
jgi:hypothetical protein